MPGKGGGGGGAGGGCVPVPNGMCGADGVDGLPKPLPVVVGDLAVSMALRGRGGAMVPKRMEASCLALPPTGRSSSSEEEGSSLESTTDHSSSSGRTREGREPVGVEEKGGRDLAFSCWVRRWKGLVETSVAEDVVVEEVGWVGAGGPDSLDWLSFLKNGFLVSLP